MTAKQLAGTSERGADVPAMKLGLTWGRLAAVTGGRLARGREDAPFDSFVTDTRTALPGAVIWALKGERHDAHEHLAAARGAAGWVAGRGRWPAEGAPGQVLEVADTLDALHALASFHRRRFKIPVAAVTGSNGKTTTKEMLAAICRQAGRTCATTGNRNNHIGLPLTLLELTGEDRFAVLEMGASHVGEIALLTRIAEPTAAVVTNVSEAHLGLFGSLERVFEAKSELPRGISGPAAVNADDPRLKRLLPELGRRAIPFGTAAGCRVRLEWQSGSAFLAFDGERIRLSGPASLSINAMNAAAAAAGALALGFGRREIEAGLAAFSPPAMRMEIRSHPTGAVIVLDAYNANPASAKAALQCFLDSYPERDKIAVLGDMKELGERSPELHRALGAWLAGLPLRAAFLAGPEMRPAAEALAAASFEHHHADDPLSLLPDLRRAVGPGTAVFFKGSRAMALERLAERL